MQRSSGTLHVMIAWQFVHAPVKKESVGRGFFLQATTTTSAGPVLRITLTPTLFG